MAELFPEPFRHKSRFGLLPSFRFPFRWDWEEEGPEMLEATQLSLSEDNDNVYVEAPMPGLKPEDIKINLENGILRIQGEKKEEKKEGRRYHRKASYSYSYMVSLPSQTDEADPMARYKDGIMSVTFRKLPERKGKVIPVQKD